MYNNYTVIASKITAMFQSVDSTYNHLCGISVKKVTTAVLTGQQEIEQGETVYRMIGNQASSNGACVLSRGASVKKLTGSKAVIGEDVFAGDVSNNPTTQYYYHVWADPNNGIDTTGVACHVIIDFIVVFSDLKSISQS